ncbi:MAG: hypothetical protein KatS3mg028_0030 [Bacteroidia bacterium]|nr:MAG: hypothetical protein KatS3mg028_0030 [Bacteroidia bacterium]
MKYFLLIVGMVLMSGGCKKKPAPTNNENSSVTNNGVVKVYMSADKNTIRLGQESVITASVSGGEGSLTYQWEVNSIANLLGSGNTVTFSPCCSSVAGDNIIKCTVSDSKGNKGIGQITIVVNP